MLKLFLKYYSDPKYLQIKDVKSRIPIVLAISAGHSNIVEILLPNDYKHSLKTEFEGALITLEEIALKNNQTV